MAQGLRKLIALAGVGVVLLTSCGGSDESSNRQRNSALTTCSTVTAGEPKATTLPTGGYDVYTTVELCDTAAKFSVVGADGTTSPVQIGPDRKGGFLALTYTDRSSDFTIRLYDSNDSVIGDEVISLSLKRNEEACNTGGPCKDGDIGPGGGTVVSARGRLYEYDKEGGPLIARFPKCTLPEGVNAETATPFDAGLGKANTDFLIANCGNEGGTLFKVLADFNSQRAFQDWVIPTVGDLEAMFVGRANSLVAHVRASGENSDVLGLHLSSKTPTFVQPEVVKPVIPIRYIELVPEYTVDASVSVVEATAPSGGEQAAPGLPPVSDMTVTYTGSDVTFHNFMVTYLMSDDDLAKVDGFEMKWRKDGATEDLVDSAFAKMAPERDGDKFVLRPGFVFDQIATGDVVFVTLTPYVSSSTDASSYTVDSSAAVTAQITVDLSGAPATGGTPTDTPSATPSQPEPPTGLAMSDDEVLTWEPVHTSTNNFAFDPAVYPYKYRVSWRVAGSEDTYAQTGDSPGIQLSWENGTFDADREYEFIVEEVLYDVEGNVVSVSAPSSPLTVTPVTAAEVEQRRAAEIAAIEASRVAAVECLKEAPQLELVLIDPTQRTVEETAPVNSDDRVRFSVIHPCINDSVAQLFFTVEEINPTTRVSLWRRSTDFETTGPVYIESPGRRLSPGPHTVIASARWFKQDPDRTGDPVLVSKTTEWTFEVDKGTKNFDRRCLSSDVSLEGRTLTIDCDGLKSVRWNNSDVPSNKVGISADDRTVTLPVFPDGWNRFGLRINQEQYGVSRHKFMVCLRNCDPTRLESEFTLALDGDTASVSFKQNECGGVPKARVAEYVKISDSLYFSYNSALGVSRPRVSDDKPLALVLQPYTSALRGQRVDHCGKKKDTVYSFELLNRVAAPVPALDEIVVPPFTEVLLEPDEVVSSEQTTIAVPNRVENVTIPNEVAAALAPTGGTVTVSIDNAEPAIIEVDNDISLELPPTAKVMSFRVTDKKGRVTVVSKPIVRLEDAEVVTQVDKAGETVPKVTASPAPELESSNSSTLYIAIAAVLAFVVLGGGVTVLRRRKG